MPHPPNDPILIGFAFGTLILSIATGLYLISARRAGPLLPYEPRRPVPWGPIGGFLAFLSVLFALMSATGGKTDSSEEPLQSVDILGSLVVQIFIVGGFLFLVAAATHANIHDLGLPTRKDRLARDIFSGFVAFLAALAPVHIVQYVLLSVLFPRQDVSGHQLIRMVTSGPPDMGLLLAAGAAAVIVAPICEEIAFRLLLQGWLERFEDEQLGLSPATANLPAANDEARAANDEQPQPTDTSAVGSHSAIQHAQPRAGIAGLPHGWFPILISATAFGLAHFGYGPEPVPLYLLGLVLGYLYQRTHRIVPGIIAHALFNLFTMIVLWWTVFHAS
jgi:membrane protease YdiL (CAAX protease family)